MPCNLLLKVGPPCINYLSGLICFWFLTLSCYVTSVESGDTGKLDLSFMLRVDGLLQHPVLHQLAKVLPSVLL